MILADRDIRKAIKDGEIRIDDFDSKRLQPTSYDILLGNKFVVTLPEESPIIDPVKKIFPKTKNIHVPDGGEFILHPGVSVLGISRDFFGSDHYLIQLSGKSSLARLGLLVHNTAGIINPGHFLNITLELCNLNTVPIKLRPKMPIAQLLFFKITSPSDLNYRQTGRYTDNNWDHYIPPKKRTKTKK
jgi:dCTP deaminase